MKKKLGNKSTLICGYPYSRWEDNEDSVEDDESGEKAQEKEPKPEEDVDLLIHCKRSNII